MKGVTKTTSHHPIRINTCRRIPMTPTPMNESDRYYKKGKCLGRGTPGIAHRELARGQDVLLIHHVGKRVEVGQILDQSRWKRQRQSSAREISFY